MSGKRATSAQPRKKAPRCKTCGKAIRVPKGWTFGPAVRRHYWAKHPEKMQPNRAAKKR